MTGATGRRTVVLLSPSLDAISGVSAHVGMLCGSELAREFELLHFEVGREGHEESPWQTLARLALSPFRLGLFLQRSRADVLHVNTSLDAKAFWRDLVYVTVARLLGRRVVTQIHGGALPDDFFKGHQVRTLILRRFLLAADVVVVLARSELRAYRAFDRRINVRLVPNAIDPAGLADQARTCNVDGTLRLVYVGRLVRDKGVFEMIEALKQLSDAGRQFDVSIAGGGAQYAELVTRVDRAGLHDRVHFLGSVFGPDKRRLWLASDVMVLPSYREGLPYALLEAMAAGCVPVATPVGAIPDVMEDGEYGVLVSPHDPAALAAAIAALDDDRGRLERLATAGRRRVLEHYSVARVAADVRALYDALVPCVPS